MYQDISHINVVYAITIGKKYLINLINDYVTFVIVLKGSALFLAWGLCFLPWKVSNKSQICGLATVDTMPSLLLWTFPSQTTDQNKQPFSLKIPSLRYCIIKFKKQPIQYLKWSTCLLPWFDHYTTYAHTHMCSISTYNDCQVKI